MDRCYCRRATARRRATRSKRRRWPEAVFRQTGILMATDPDREARPTELPSAVRLLIVTTVAETIRRFLLPYADHYRRAGWSVAAATSEPARFPELVAHFDGVHEVAWSRSISNPRNVVEAVPAMRNLLNRWRPDVVHVHTPIAAFVTRFAIRSLPLSARPAVVYTAHGFHFFRGGSRRSNLAYLTAERIAGRWTDRLIVINREDELAAMRARIVPLRALVRMNGIGVDMSLFDGAGLTKAAIDAARRAAGVPAAAPMFVMVAELHPNKRPTDAVRALAAMHRTDAHLVFAGDGRMRGDVERLASRLGLGDRTHLPGYVEDIAPLVASATATILPSQREGLSRALMESLCLAVPAIASDARGNEEIIGDGAGLTFAVGDIRAMAECMGRLVSDPALRARLVINGRARVESRFALPHLIAAHDRLYVSLLGERAALQ